MNFYLIQRYGLLVFYQSFQRICASNFENEQQIQGISHNFIDRFSGFRYKLKNHQDQIKISFEEIQTNLVWIVTKINYLNCNKPNKYIIKQILMNSKSIKDFQLLTVVGKGTYAKVCLARYNEDSKVYAIKILKKKYIIEKDQVEHIMTEKQILSKVQHPFLVHLKASFQDEKKLYFVLQYCPGGQLFGLLSLKDKLSQEQTKFYSAQILLAMQSLHSRGIIYRDLKPENVLLDKQGYIKLTDFGLSRLLKNQGEMAMSVCGTPQYLAPEILQKKGHNQTVDWWCLGCIIYQMITGYPPYKHKNRMQLFEAIISQQFPIPETSDKLQNLLIKLLQKDPNKRLGAKGAGEIKSHPWFQKIKWEALINKAIKSPFVPILSSDIDTSNFDQQFTNCSVQSYQEQGMSNGMDEEVNQGKFAGFSYENSLT